MKPQTRSTRIMGVALLAALALSAAASANAGAALPSYSNCVATEGPFVDAGCHHVKAPGGWAILPFEFAPPVNGFNARGGKTGVSIETSSMQMVSCHSVKASGELIGTKDQRAVVDTLVSCRMGGQRCTSAGAQPGRIVTSPLSGVLGYLAGAGTSTPTVGISISSEAGPVAEFMCGMTGVRLQGSVLGVVSSDVDFVSKVSTETFSQLGGVQSFTSFEGGSPGALQLRAEVNMGGGYQPAGTAGLAFSERLEVPVATEVEA